MTSVRPSVATCRSARGSWFLTTATTSGWHMHNDSLLLSALAGWRAGSVAPSLEVSDVVRLRQAPASIRPLVDGTGSFGGLTAPTGLAIDPEGRIYILDGCENSALDGCGS